MSSGFRIHGRTSFMESTKFFNGYVLVICRIFSAIREELDSHMFSDALICCNYNYMLIFSLRKLDMLVLSFKGDKHHCGNYRFEMQVYVIFNVLI